MKIFYSIQDWQKFRRTNLFNKKTLGLVPTMGNLHAGHQSLLSRSVKENNLTLLTIFINPTQFNEKRDFENYPKTLQQDIAIAKATNVDFLLIPTYSDIYPDQYRYKIGENKFSQQLCGKYRPEHFDGVLTIVLKLLMLAKAHRAYFGEKDYQQLALVKDMVNAFFIETEIIACPTIRNENNLALSSRNNLLSSAQLELAHHFPKLLHSRLSNSEIINELTQLGFSVDYVEEHGNRRYGAARLGDVRLIDNILLPCKQNR